MAIKIPGVVINRDPPRQSPAYAPPKDTIDYDRPSSRPTSYKSNSAKAPMNIDDLPVGGNGDPYDNPDAFPSAASSAKKPIKVEEFHHPSYDSYGSKDQNDDSDLPLMERPIRPKATVDYNDRDPVVETDVVDNRPAEHFAKGEHPLEGVPRFMELAAPEPLSSKSRYLFDSFISVVILNLMFNLANVGSSV